MHLEERKIKEIEHSNRRRSIVRAHEYYSEASQEQLSNKYIEKNQEFEQHFSNMKFYSVTQTSFAYRDKTLFKNIKGATALDYCCGNGEVAIEMARQGASRVVGIDISPVAIENAKELAREQGVKDRCEFLVMDAEQTEFPDNTFDIIHEYGALHHLELLAVFKELSRILKPEGQLVCTEALRHNPLIHWYRKRTPHLRTKWEVEHILGVDALNDAQKYFGEVNAKFFHLLVLAAVPFRKTLFFKPLRTIFDSIDRIILSNQFIGKYAWIMVFSMSYPRK